MLRKSTVGELINRQKASMEIQVGNFQNGLDIYTSGHDAGDIRALTGKALAKKAAGLVPRDYLPDLIEAIKHGEVSALVLVHSELLDLLDSKTRNEIEQKYRDCVDKPESEFFAARFEFLAPTDLVEAFRNLIRGVIIDPDSMGSELARIILFACWDVDLKNALIKASKTTPLEAISELDFNLETLKSCNFSDFLTYEENLTWNQIKDLAQIKDPEFIPAPALEVAFLCLARFLSHEVPKFNQIITKHLDHFPADHVDALTGNPSALVALAQTLHQFGTPSAMAKLTDLMGDMGILQQFENLIYGEDSFFDEWDEITDSSSSSSNQPVVLNKQDLEVLARIEKTDALDEEIEEAIEEIRSGAGSWKKVIKLFKKYRKIDEEGLGERWFYEEELTQLVNDNDDLLDVQGEFAIKDPNFFFEMFEFIPVGGCPELVLASSKNCPKEIILKLLSPEYAPMDAYSLSVQQVVAEMHSDIDYFKLIIEQGSDAGALHTLLRADELTPELLFQLSKMPIFTVETGNREFLSHLIIIIDRPDVTVEILEVIRQRAEAVMAGGSDWSINNVEMALEIEKAATKRLKSLS